MASGLPVLAYRSAAAAELIVDGDNGRLVAPGDGEAYVRIAGEMAMSAEKWPRMGVAARASMHAHRWSSVVERFETVVREAMC